MDTNEKTLAVSNGEGQALANIDQQQLSVNASEELTLANDDLKELAQKLKIQNLQQQRDFIYNMLEKKSHEPFKDGNVEFRYKGFMFPEVQKAFETAGFAIIPLKPATAIGYFDEVQVNIIKLADSLILSEEELEESRKYAEDLQSKNDNRQIGTLNSHCFGSEYSPLDEDEDHFIQRIASEINTSRGSSSPSSTSYDDNLPNPIDASDDEAKSPMDSELSFRPKTSSQPVSNQSKRIQKARNRQNRKKKHKH